MAAPSPQAVSGDSAASPQAAPTAEVLYSITAHFDGACNVLLTGASGYIGSLVLEKLLRSTTVGRVYVLLRSRRGVAPAERLAKLLTGPLFHLLDETQTARVTAVAGDILEPGLGLSAEDEATLVANVDTVIHSAADIRLDAPIQTTLKANYSGSRAVVALAARMKRLRSVVYLATCYVNINKPPGFEVEERLYSLQLDGSEELMALPSEEATALAAKYIDLWGFKNTYAMGKHLAEKAVVRLAGELLLPLAIVRPSLVSAVAAEPFVGYAGNYAGPVGAALAYLVGLYNDQPEAAAMGGGSVWDIVPGDTVAHAVIAAAAAAASPEARALIAGGGGSEAAAAPPPPMIVQVATSCTYPLTASFMFNHAVLWCAAHPRPFTLAFGRARGMDPNQQYDEGAWRKHMATAKRKVEAVAWILSHLGKELQSAAKFARYGLRTYETINTPKYDLRLFFKVDALARLEAALCPEDRASFAIVWRPPPPPPPAAAAAGEGTPQAAARRRRGALRALACGCLSAPGVHDAAAHEGGGGGHDAAAPEAVVIAAGAKSAAALRGAEARARAAEMRAGGWVLFFSNLMACMYQELYSRQVPRAARVPRRALRAVEGLLDEEHKAGGGVMRHAFERAGGGAAGGGGGGGGKSRAG
ncbi:hypothetical protein Rsub_03864 [Raphidocelis subcapitata]|uniref:Fatty acyl-CoA reductase n=1 Tax=Raphidocelis subcapitata TaxID=307507 RepID=A0A2V0NUK1_9CHLO|nr:hypothetical protein Rsub_03864 [Raphidocelis subcapitata]|eukprot:GBF91009.1 hypothetical protein Rsub_03864 [Raphidocelis subcapitata]